MNRRTMLPRRHRRLRRAFTLMEVLLVVAILLILASIVALNYSGVFGGAEENATKIQMNLIAKGVKLFKFECRRPPASLEELNIKPADLENKWHGPYLDSAEIPKDAWGNPFTFTDNQDGSFTLTSQGAGDGKGPITVTERY
jgi:general secretion pathway protein G